MADINVTAADKAIDELIEKRAREAQAANAEAEAERGRCAPTRCAARRSVGRNGPSITATA